MVINCMLTAEFVPLKYKNPYIDNKTINKIIYYINTSLNDVKIVYANSFVDTSPFNNRLLSVDFQILIKDKFDHPFLQDREIKQYIKDILILFANAANLEFAHFHNLDMEIQDTDDVEYTRNTIVRSNFDYLNYDNKVDNKINSTKQNYVSKGNKRKIFVLNE